MISSKKRMFFLISWMALVVVSSLAYYTYAVTWTISLDITGIWLRHGTPDNVNLWVITASTGDQEISGQFTDYFRIEDLEWYVTGHYTTVQCDGIYGPYGIRLTWVYLKAGNDFPILVRWSTGNNVFIATWLTDDYVSILSPVTYIYKATNPNNAGIINRYGDMPRLKIVIPGGTPPGMYSGTIVFSFYME